jgi:hypothetical protein
LAGPEQAGEFPGGSDGDGECFYLEEKVPRIGKPVGDKFQRLEIKRL